MTIHPVENLGPSIGLYSHAVFAPAGTRLVAVSGQLSVDERGDTVHADDFESQMTQVFSNLRRVLVAAGGDQSSLLKMTTYLTHPDLVERFYAHRVGLFADWFPDDVHPGNTLLVISRLVRPEFMIEVEALAAVPDMPAT